MPYTGKWSYNTWNTGTSTQQQLNSIRAQYNDDTGVWTQWVGGSLGVIDPETKEQRIKRRWRENL